MPTEWKGIVGGLILIAKRSGGMLRNYAQLNYLLKLGK